MSEPDLDAVKDRFLSLLRQSLNRFYPTTVREWCDSVIEAIAAIRGEFGEREALLCAELSKQILYDMVQHGERPEDK